tara:strand:- start:3519 stop:4307 length:789 start_codon:yes stop_codon:yes gene_type:complete
MSLTSKSPSDTYKDLLHMDNSNNGIDGTVRQVKSGQGDASPISVSTNKLLVKPSSNTTATLDVQNSGGTSILSVDSTNTRVLGPNNVYMNTQYAYFGVADSLSTNWSANTHYPLPYTSNSQTSSVEDNMTLGTGTDPATTFTTADGSSTDASLIVPKMWLLPDAITIDAVYSLEGGDNATGATTRMHLMSYTFTSGSTSALTEGTLLAHNSDVTNAGSEQAYKSTWTVDSASVAADKVILATFLTTDVTGDYSASIVVKYHL